jgi:hypothetical protein
MQTLREVRDLYARTWRTYLRWARTLLPLAVVVFVPLGLIHAIPAHLEAESLDFEGWLQVGAILIAVVALSTGGLLGEVFYAGAVSIALTHPHDGEPPTLREVAGLINYKRLIVVDIVYALSAALGFAALIVPGVLIYVYFGLTAPVVEIEGRTVREGFKRSLSLVRGHFWLVAAVLIPIEIAGDALTNGATALSHGLIADSILDEWAVDTLTNLISTPFYAVAVVLLTLDLIGARDGAAPELHASPP